MKSLFPRWRFMAEQWPTITFTLALGITYWLVRERDERVSRAHEKA